MLRTAFVLVLALGALDTARAQRIIDPVETSFEIPLALATLPASGVGDVSFKTCDKCTSYSRLLTPSTRFFVSGREVAAADFVAAAGDIRKAETGNPRALLTLHVDKKTTDVNRAAISRP
jgi:hypothetical protein